MKGNAWRGVQEFIQAVAPGGMAAVSPRLSEATQRFFAQMFVPSAWYDILPIEEITRASALLTGETHTMHCRALADFILKRDSTGLYRAILRFATPELMVRALPFATKRYFDFVKLDVHNVDQRSYRVIVSGVPQLVAMTYITITNVFITRAIEGSGGRNVICEISTPVSAGAVSASPTVKFERRLSWSG
jgi:hypothetical protein